MKKILLFLIVLCSIISGYSVNAQEASFYEDKYIPGEYITKVKDGYKKYKQMREFKRVSDNRLAYCIELWENLNSNKTLPGYDFNSDNYSNITSDILDRVMLISYYGYGYLNHTDIKWYAITQFMIWKETSPATDIYFTDTLNGNRISKYENEIQEINNLVNSHIKLPSFHKTTHYLNYNEWYIITDTNNYLENFNIINSSNLEIIKDGNIIKVKSRVVGDKELELINKDNMYSNYPIVYIDDVGQDLLVTGSYYPYYSKVDFVLKSGSLIVNKLDFDTRTNSNIGTSKLDGSKFQLLDNEKNVVATGEVSNGKIIFNNIPYGKYYLKEIKAGVGYNINNELKEIIIDRDSVSINYYNKVIKNKIIIHKCLRNTLTSSALDEENAVFDVYDGEKKIYTIKTDYYGKAELELPYGTYTLKQVSGQKNYKLAEDIIINVSIDGKTQWINLYNDSYVFNFGIVDLDSDSLKPILEEGSIFKIRNVDTNMESELITDKDGKTDIIGLTAGNYEITQLSVVDGYNLNEEIMYIDINEDEYSIDNEIIIPVLNEKKKSKIEFSKIIEYYFNDNLKDSKIDNNIMVPIYAKEDIYSKDGMLVYEKGEIVDNVSYNGSNLVSKELVLGNYYVNDLDEKIVDVTLDNEDTKKVSFLAKVFEYENERIIDVENTLSYKNIFEDYYIFLILLGLLLVRRIKHE